MDDAHFRDIRTRFDLGLRERAPPARRRSDELRNALRCGELELVYQPIVEAASLHIASFEALLRWNHPVPASFIPTISSLWPSERGSSMQSARGYCSRRARNVRLGHPA